ncbi:MAG: endoribonuclease MazF [Candidatus Krumholzibacteriota bacterium]
MVAPGRYVPQRGDIVWLQFAHQAGHEQSGRRPALVVSPESYNGRVGLALFCPITSHIKGYPFEVALDSPGKAEGVVLSDQIKSLDWRARKVRKFDRVSDAVMREVAARIGALVG